MSHLNSLKDLVEFSASIETKLIESGGELTPDLEQQVEMLSLIQGEALPQKVDSVQYVLVRLETLTEEWKERAAQIQAVARGLEASRERLKDYVKGVMLNNATDELAGVEFRFKLNRTKPKLLIKDQAAIPSEFIREVIVKETDKEGIRAALEAGKPVAGAELEPSFGLRAYPNKATTSPTKAKKS